MESRTLTGKALAPGAAGLGGEAPTPEPQPEIAKQTLAPTPETMPLVSELVVALATTKETDEGLSIPLRQLELAIGALVVTLAFVPVWIARRPRRRFV